MSVVGGGRWRAVALVGAGGAVGTLARHGIAEWWAPTGSWPWPTFVVNVLGSLLLGLLVARVTRPDDPRRLLLGTGVLGGFTTYSASAVETDALLRAGDTVVGLLYPLATVALGLTAALAGMILGRRA